MPYFMLYEKERVEIDARAHSELFIKGYFDVKRHYRVGLNIVDGVTVSTVFEHSCGVMRMPNPKFETRIFGGKYDGKGEKYYTWDGALEGHDSIVAALMLGEEPPVSRLGW